MLLRAVRLNVLIGLALLVLGSTATAQTAATRPTLTPAAAGEAAPADQPTGLIGKTDVVWQHVTFDTRPAGFAAPRRSLFRDIAGDFGRFFTSKETYGLLAVGLTGALSVRGLDDNIVRSPFNSEREAGGLSAVDGILDPGAVLGGAEVQLGAALAAYGFGHWLDKPAVAELGRDLLRAQILTQSVTHAIKHTARRTRPDGSSQSSFPSGHTAGAFATATVLRDHYGWKVGGPAYAVATYIAASRLSENRHFLSDVVFGAAIGLAAGRTIGFSAGAARFDVSPFVAPGGGGVTVTISR